MLAFPFDRNREIEAELAGMSPQGVARWARQQPWCLEHWSTACIPYA